MKSPSVVLPEGVQTPRVRHAPSVRGNAWEDLSDLAKAYGTVLEPWQENVLAAAMGERADGTFAAKHVGLSVPRQNGKGTLLEVRALGGLFLFGEQMIVHSAHEVRTAQIGFTRLKSYFENYDDLRKKVAGIGNAVAREYIRLKTGQEIKFVTRSKSAIRGFSADCLLLDEAQILDDVAWEAILYTVSARPNHQIWLVGTPPTDPAQGVVFGRFRQRGLEAKDHRLAWCEFSAPPGCDLDDMASVAVANPALGGRITHSTVLDERAAASDESYARERLGMWTEMGAQRVISADTWAAIRDPYLVDGGGAVALAVDVAPDRDVSAVVACGQATDGTAYVDVVETRAGEPDWIVTRVAEMCRKHDVRAVVVDGRSAANTLIDPLQKARVTVTVTTATQMAKAFGGFYDAVMSGQVKHMDQPVLNTALAVARKRSIGDGGFGWSRKDSDADITPIVGATLAFWGLSSSEIVPKRTGKATFV